MRRTDRVDLPIDLTYVDTRQRNGELMLGFTLLATQSAPGTLAAYDFEAQQRAGK
jgi:hypothetical protein